jgi:hypothetical protein
MKRIFIAVFFLLLAFNFFLASWFVRHGDIRFSSDIGRDFFIFQEIHSKGLVLIGGRTSSGIFHGPLWQYLNMPSYLLGGGNPVVVGWYWLFLIGLSLVADFYIAKNLFNRLVAYLFIILLSLVYVFQAPELINPHGAMLVMVIFFYAFIRYIQTYKLRYLILYSAVIAAIIQFEVAVGGPLILLSLPVIFFKSIHAKKKTNLLALFIVLVGVSNYFLFDLRHNFLLAKKIIEYVSIKNYTTFHTYLAWAQDRITSMVIRIGFLKDGGPYNTIFSIFFFVLLFTQIRNKKYGLYYAYFLYFYVGYIVLSFFNQGDLLSYYIYPWFPLLLLIFTSLVTSKYKVITLVAIGIIYVLNLQAAIRYLKNADDNFIGKNIESWKFLSTMTKETFSQKNIQAGYFTYTPDTLGYAIKYAAKYTVSKEYYKNIYYFTKKPVTYLFVEPPPANDQYMLEGWWIKVKLRVDNKPAAIKEYANGYKVETFALIDRETRIPADALIDPGLHFR